MRVATPSTGDDPMFGMSLEKLVLVMLIAAVLIGPTRLPDYARRLSAFTRSANTSGVSALTRILMRALYLLSRRP